MDPLEHHDTNAADRDALLADLLARCALRDRNALRVLYEEVADKLNGVAFRITQAPDITEDVLQVSFIQIWRDAERYHPDIAGPMTWMTSIVRQRAHDRLNVGRRGSNLIDENIELEVDQLASVGRGALEHFALNESQSDLRYCLERMSEGEQRSVMLAYYYGYSREEIAAKLNTTVSNVKSWMHRGLQRLEQCLQQ